MSESVDVALVKKLYDSGVDPAVMREVMSPDLIWDITPGFPFGGVYKGLDSVQNDFFGQLGPSVDSLTVNPEQYFDSGEGHVIVLGHYHVINGDRTQDVRFTHLWAVRDGRLASLTQVADSHLARQVING